MRFIYLVVFCCVQVLFAQSHSSISLARLQYNGGGDWYVSPTSLPNLIEFSNKNLNTNIRLEEEVVQVGNSELFNFAFVHMTGHGNIVFSNHEADNLRKYLLAGGFLHINDSYGMDPYIRTEMKKVFPELDFVDIPFDHAIYKAPFVFKDGLPKVHEHDGKTPRGLGIFYEGKLLVFYNYECDLADGWEDEAVHNDLPEIREKALRMGANILYYVFQSKDVN